MTTRSMSVISTLALMLTSTAFYGNDTQADEKHAPLHTVENTNHPKGWAMSLSTGLMRMDNKLTNDNTTFNLHYKNNFTRVGLGITHYWTFANKTVAAVGVDLFGGFNSKTVDATLTQTMYHLTGGVPTGFPKDAPVPSKYKQVRPFSALVFAKLGYTYDNFTPFLMIGARQTYVRHHITPTATGKKRIDRDIAFSLTPGVGFMYKRNNWAIGAEYLHGEEIEFGLDAYATKIENRSRSAVIRLSYFF